MRQIALLVALAAVQTVGTGAVPREQPVQQQVEQPPIFRTGIELVRIDVRAVDEAGVPVRDLRPDEIAISEAGEERPILLFQHVQQPVGSYAEVARRTIASEVSTNQGSPRGHVYVLVFDQFHITAGNEQRVRMAAERFLRTKIRPGDRIAVYALPGPGPQIDFTSDVTRAINELVSIRGSRDDSSGGAVVPMTIYDAYEITRGNDETLTRYINAANDPQAGADTTGSAASRQASAREPEDPAVVRRVVTENARSIVARADQDARQFLQQMADVVAALREVDGRKAVLLFSEGFEIDNVGRELEEVAAAAAQSYSVVFGFDLNRRFQNLQDQGPRSTSLAAEILSRLQSIGSLASETDGELFVDASARADSLLDRVSEASQDYYLVGFQPSAAALKDRRQYRRIKVSATRPGVRLSSRTGYSLGPDLSQADRRRAIDTALRVPFSQQGLKVEYTTYVLRGSSSDAQRVMLSLAAELPIVSGESRAADVVFAVRDVRTGQLAASGADTLSLPETSSPGATMGMGYYRVQFELPPGTYLMRAVVREPGGSLGSADRRFQVRTLSGPSVSAGDLILGSTDTRGLPVRTVVYASEVLAGISEIYARSSSQLAGASVGVELLPFGDVSAVTSGRADLGEIQSDSRGAKRSVKVELPLEGIEPGEYVVRATVRHNQETVAELLRDVTIAAGTRPAAPPAPAVAPPTPTVVLQGEVIRQWLASLRGRAAGTPAEAAASLAASADWSGAEKALPAAAEPGPVAAALAGVVRFSRGDFAGAVAPLRMFTAAEPGDASAAFLLGWAHAGAADDRSAIGAWRAAIVANGRLVPAYLAAIDAYLRLGEPSLALQVAKAGVTAVPESPELRARLEGLARR